MILIYQVEGIANGHFYQNLLFNIVYDTSRRLNLRTLNS